MTIPRAPSVRVDHMIYSYLSEFPRKTIYNYLRKKPADKMLRSIFK